MCGAPLTTPINPLAELAETHPRAKGAGGGRGGRADGGVRARVASHVDGSLSSFDEHVLHIGECRSGRSLLNDRIVTGAPASNALLTSVGTQAAQASDASRTTCSTCVSTCHKV